MDTRKPELVIEFSAEQASQRVGWTSVREFPRTNAEPYYVADIAVATVSDEGASLSISTYKQDGEQRQYCSKDSVLGFEDVSGLSVTILPNIGIIANSGGIHFRNADQNELEHDQGIILLRGASSSVIKKPREEEKVWGNNPEDVLSGLKTELDRFEMAEHYPKIYYYLNGCLGHSDFALPTYEKPRTSKYIPDPDQRQQTEEQIELARKITVALGSSVQNDLRQINLLGELGGRSPDDQRIDSFVKSRKTAHELEAEISDTYIKILANSLVYLPIGFRPNGRSWPYIDAGSSDPQTAFGVELDELKNGSADLAISELKREQKELSHRNIYASKGFIALCGLGEAEREALS